MGFSCLCRFDFYLVPQFVKQGTVTPVNYNVVHDETRLGPDKHQRLAFKLCHLYYNWQGLSFSLSRLDNHGSSD